MIGEGIVVGGRVRIYIDECAVKTGASWQRLLVVKVIKAQGLLRPIPALDPQYPP